MDIATVNDATAATEAEHRMGLLESIKLYRKACLWSLFLSTCIVMDGFDLALLPGLFAYPPFRRAFGQQQQHNQGNDGEYQLSASWQAGLLNGALCGQIVGLFLNGLVAEQIGHRATLMTALAACTGLVCVPFFARSLPQLLVGEILLGVPWGVCQTLATTYAAEVCPTALRAQLTAYCNLCWVLGQLFASGVLRAMLARDDDWGWRIPFALQWVWPLPLAIGIWMAPESPWWLVRKGRLQDAKRALVRLTSGEAEGQRGRRQACRRGGEIDIDIEIRDNGRDDEENVSRDDNTESGFDANRAVAMMVHTTRLEEAMAGGSSYLDLFRGVNLRRTEIACVVWTIQTLCGNSLIGYSTYFYEQAGLGLTSAFTMTLGQYALGAAGTVVSWSLMARFGRRSLYLAGLLLMAAVFLATGLIAVASGRGSNGNDGSDNNRTAQWAIGSLLLVYTFVYDCTVGPVCFCLVAELPSTRLRTKSVALARNAYNVVSIASNVMTPRMLNPTAWNWGGRCGFFWAASCLACAAWTFWRLPEPKGRTFGELDVLFEKDVPARRFREVKVDAVGGEIPGVDGRVVCEKEDGPRTTCADARR